MDNKRRFEPKDVSDSIRRAQGEKVPRAFKVLGVPNDIGMPDVAPPVRDPEREVNEAFAQQFQDENMLIPQDLSEEELAERTRAIENIKALRKLKEAQMRGEVPEHLKALVNPKK